MRLNIHHETFFAYDEAAHYALLQLRLRPQSNTSQTVQSWDVDYDGARHQARFTDQYGNLTDLVEVLPDRKEVRIQVGGVIETLDQAGLSGPQADLVPLWLYRRSTALTKPDAAIRKMAQFAQQDGTLPTLHALSQTILEAVPYVTGQTAVTTTAGEAFSSGKGVCQDHTHIFLSAARSLDIPARYVSGYLMMDDREHQEAGHAWAEAYVEDLGWVGFDVSNGISPDARYVGVARGLDYSECAPTRGIRFGQGQEALEVSIQVQQ